jgi:acetyl esterase/lipase
MKASPVSSFRIVLTALLCALTLSGCATTTAQKKAAPSSRISRDIGSTQSVELRAPKAKSFSCRIVEIVARFASHRQIWDRDVEGLADYLRKTDQSKLRVPPAKFYRQFDITETTVEGGRRNFVISSRKNPRHDKVVMFLHSGGFVFEMFPSDWNVVGKIVSDLSIPVCVSNYPIYPETNPEAIMSFVVKSYEQLLAAHPGAEVIILGGSAGADIMLSLCHYLSLNSGLPFPAKLICVSPAMVVDINDAMFAAMREIAPHDPVLSIKMIETLPLLFNLPQDRFDLFNAPLYGDFSQFPPIYLFSGTYDIFYPQMAPFVERVRAQGKHIEFYSGYELVHCWPFMPVAPENEAALSIIFDIIQETGGQP